MLQQDRHPLGRRCQAGLAIMANSCSMHKRESSTSPYAVVGQASIEGSVWLARTL